MGDVELAVQYARRRDAGAFAELVRRYQSLVWGTCRRTCHEAADAEDATQEVFLRLAQNAGALHSNLGGWLHRCAVNVAVDLNRKRARRKTHEDAARQQMPTAGEDHQAMLIELREQVDLAMSKLDDEQRELLAQRYLQGRPQTELAQEHGVSPATMTRRLQQAINALRQHLQTAGGASALSGVGVLEGLLESQAAVAPAVPAGLTASLAKIGLSGVPAGVAGGMALTAKLLIAAGVLAAAGIGAAIWAGRESPQVAATQPAPPQANVVAAPAIVATPEQTAQARRTIFELRATPFLSDQQWIQELRDLVNLGPAAVPDIIAELDRAPSDSQMRAMAFALRLIGDKRAIPALIRALPRTAERTSDFGLAAKDRALWQFMRDNDIDPSNEAYPRFGYARAVRLTNAALEKLTGHAVGEKAFYSPQATSAAAMRWQQWWQANREKYPEALAYEKPYDGADNVAEAGKGAGALFPTGPDVRIGPVIERELQPQGKLDQACWLDLDTGRTFEPLEGFTDRPKEEAQECYVYWPRLAGVDCNVTEVMYSRKDNAAAAVPFDDKGDFRLLQVYGDGTRTWKVDDGLWANLDSAVRTDALKLPATVRSDFHENVPVEQAAVVPLTYLFITREGARGILQITDSSAAKGVLKLRYRLWEGTGRAATQPALRDQAATGATFGPEKDITLAGPTGGADSGYSLGQELVIAMPYEAELPEFSAPAEQRKAAFEQLYKWMDEQGVDWVTDRDVKGSLCGIRTRGGIAAEVSGKAWDHMTAQHAADLVRRSFAWPSSQEAHMTGFELPATYIVKTRNGTLATVQLTAINHDPEELKLRYRVIQNK